MIIEFTSGNFTENSGFYYSSPFKIETKDTLMTIEVSTSISTTVSMQQSINGETWYDVLNSEFLCNTSAMQSYIECQPELLFRLKSLDEVINAKILI